MKFSNEALMAYADGELDAETCAKVEAAMAADPDTALRVAHHLALAHKVNAAFDPVLREAVPKRLKDAGAARANVAEPADGATAAVIDIATARTAKPARSTQRWSWPQWSAIAASLVIGVLAGHNGLSDTPQSQMAMDGGGIVARGTLARVLSTQLASTQASDAPVRIGISFLSKSGEYCRTFSLPNGIAGLGCRMGPEWRLQVLARSPTPTPAPSAGTYRMAAGDAPAAVMREVEERITGNSFDAREEEAALRIGWHK